MPPCCEMPTVAILAVRPGGMLKMHVEQNNVTSSRPRRVACVSIFTRSHSRTFLFGPGRRAAIKLARYLDDNDFSEFPEDLFSGMTALKFM